MHSEKGSRKTVSGIIANRSFVHLNIETLFGTKFQALGVYHCPKYLTQIILMTDIVADSRKSVPKVSNMVHKLSHVGLKRASISGIMKEKLFVRASKRGHWVRVILDDVQSLNTIGAGYSDTYHFM